MVSLEVEHGPRSSHFNAIGEFLKMASRATSC